MITQQPNAAAAAAGGGGDGGAVLGGHAPEVPVQSLPPVSTLSLLKYAEANIIVPTWENTTKNIKEKKE